MALTQPQVCDLGRCLTIVFHVYAGHSVTRVTSDKSLGSRRLRWSQRCGPDHGPHDRSRRKNGILAGQTCRTRLLTEQASICVDCKPFSSGCRMMPQPHRWTAIRWWKAQSKSMLTRLVGPPLDLGTDSRSAAARRMICRAARCDRRHRAGDIPAAPGSPGGMPCSRAAASRSSTPGRRARTPPARSWRHSRRRARQPRREQPTPPRPRRRRPGRAAGPASCGDVSGSAARRGPAGTLPRSAAGSAGTAIAS
jgi:hypothetical protein